MDIAAILIIRICYGLLFFMPLAMYLTHWDETVRSVGTVFKSHPDFMATCAMVLMLWTGISVFFGIYAQVGGITAIVLCLSGIVSHYRQAGYAMSLASIDLKLSTLAEMGHKSAAQKNLVMLALGVYFLLMGSGHISVTGNLW